jgi:16S rRNA (guanine966-N2)-methyltransferase
VRAIGNHLRRYGGFQLKIKTETAILQIIGGSLKGVRFNIPVRKDLRPTRSKVREAVFQIWGDLIVGAIFLDPFAGSGAIVLEAASRGADEIHASDINPEILFQLRKKLRGLQKKYPAGVGWERIVVSSADFREALSEHFTIGRKFDLIYLDPPYNTMFGLDAMKLIIRYELLKPNGRVILEISKRERRTIDAEIENLDFVLVKTYSYGDTMLYHLALEVLDYSE